MILLVVTLGDTSLENMLNELTGKAVIRYGEGITLAEQYF